MLAKNPQGSVETRRAGKRASALDTATVLDAPRPDWAPLWRAPFYCYSESYIPSAEIWVEALCGTVNNIASSWSSQFDKHESPKLNQVELREWSIQQSKDPEIVVTALGLRTYIKPGWIAVYPEYAEGFDVDFDVDDWLIAGWSSGILKDPDWDNVCPAQQLAAAWHRRLLTGLFQYWKSNFVSALESGAALIMVRKNKILAPFERVTLDQWQLFKLDDEPRAEEETKMWYDPRQPYWSRKAVVSTATGPTGERLFAIHIAPGFVDPDSGDHGHAPEEKCLQWLMELLRDYPVRPPSPLGHLAKKAVSIFPGLSRRGFQRCYFMCCQQTGNRNWSRPGAPIKSAQKSSHKN
jgi:hypothetical protein